MMRIWEQPGAGAAPSLFRRMIYVLPREQICSLFYIFLFFHGVIFDERNITVFPQTRLPLRTPLAIITGVQKAFRVH